MKIRFIAIPLLLIALLGCDKVKSLAEKAQSAVKQRVNQSTGNTDDSKMDPELGKLVNRTPEGAVFRKDLPFPEHIEVRTTLRREISGRLYQTSAIDRKAEAIKGTQLTTSKLERTGDLVRYTLEESSFSKPSLDPKKDADQIIEDPLKQASISTKPIVFHLKGNAWKTDDSEGFRAATLSKQLAPVFEDVLIENAVSPRSMWFSKRRLKVGDEVNVSGESLPMLLSGNAKGSLKLKLESFGSVDGHPCGVFSITGDYSRKKFPDFEGVFTDEEVTIQSGKIWLSLIHPLILKQELDTVQSFNSGGQGGLLDRAQGTVKVSLSRSWKAVAR